MSPTSKLRPFPKKQTKDKKANRDILEDCNELALLKANRL
jgi:hypothetical protein